MKIKRYNESVKIDFDEAYQFFKECFIDLTDMDANIDSIERVEHRSTNGCLILKINFLPKAKMSSIDRRERSFDNIDQYIKDLDKMKGLMEDLKTGMDRFEDKYKPLSRFLEYDNGMFDGEYDEEPFIKLVYTI